jgi:hypothetical protein
MPEFYKRVGIFWVSLGLGFFSFAITLGFLALTNKADNLTALFLNLALPCLVCFVVFVSGGLCGIYMDNLKSGKVQDRSTR